MSRSTHRRIVEKNFVECYHFTLDSIIILYKANERSIQSFSSLKALEIIITEKAC